MVKYDLKRVLPKKKFTPDNPPTPPPCASVLKNSGICHNFQAHDCFFTVWAQAMLCRMTTEAMQMVAARHVS